MPPCIAGTVRQVWNIHRHYDEWPSNAILTSSNLLFDTKSHISGAINVDETMTDYPTHHCLPNIITDTEFKRSQFIKSTLNFLVISNGLRIATVFQGVTWGKDPFNVRTRDASPICEKQQYMTWVSITDSIGIHILVSVKLHFWIKTGQPK